MHVLQEELPVSTTLVSDDEMTDPERFKNTAKSVVE